MTKLTLKALEKEMTPMELKVSTLTVENEFLPKAEQRTVQAICDELQISRQAYYQHRKKPHVIKHGELLADRFLDSYKARISANLVKLATGEFNGTPSTKSIELYFKLRGDLVTRTQEVNEDDDSFGTKRISDAEITAELEKLNDLLK
jgi:hypothetical protein